VKGDVMGWDVGGAHLKAARLDASGRVVGVWQEPCALWRGLDRLETALARILARADGPAASHGVTMTAEMTDLFPDREAGVLALATWLACRLGESTRFFAGPRDWPAQAGAAARWRDLASANWLATAHLAAAAHPDGILADIGSTTTDLIPIRAGRPVPRGRSDAERLAGGELVYLGVSRTPLCALAKRMEFGGRRYNVMNELFATSADVFRLTGELAADHDQQPTADGAGKDEAATCRRLARMIGMDAAGCRGLTDEGIARRALAQDRIILSRDQRLLRRKNIVFGRLVRGVRPWEQLLEIIDLFGLKPRVRPFSRCIHCNVTLKLRPKAEIQERLEPLTRKHYHVFHECPECKRIYWAGSHHERMRERLRALGISG